MPPSSGEGRGSRLNRLSSALAPARRHPPQSLAAIVSAKPAVGPARLTAAQAKRPQGSAACSDRAAGGQRQLPETAACKIRAAACPASCTSAAVRNMEADCPRPHTRAPRAAPRSRRARLLAHATALSGNPPGRAPRRFARSPDADGDRLHCRSDRHGQSCCRS